MSDPNLTAALRASLAVEEDQIEDSPLAEASADAVDELLRRINENLVDGLPQKITDSELRKLVDIYRSQAFKWAQEEQITKTRGRKKSSEKPTINFNLKF